MGESLIESLISNCCPIIRYSLVCESKYKCCHPILQETGMEVLGSRVRLHGHRDYITCMKLCQAFSIVVSGSWDTTAIIWDLNR